jgi:hypothetical protein
LTRRIDRFAAPGRGGRGRIVTRAARAALAAALAALLAGPADAATAREKSGRRGEAKRAQPDKLPNGPLLIIVSIGSQHVSLYADGTFVGRGPVSTGMRGHPTPVGVFSVIQKDRFHRSNIYSLAPMPYMQRITWSGVALHQGVLPGYPASHGCIRMSGDFAVRLWGITKLGARVIVARSDVTPAEIANPHLFVRAAEPKAEPVAERRTELRPSIETTPAVVKAAVPATAPARAASTAALPAADPDRMGGDDRVITAASVDPPPAADPAPAAEPAPEPPAIDAAKAAGDAAMQAEAPRKPGAVSVFVSKKTGRLYVRQNYQPLFDVPVEIRDPERPLGTHVFTALDVQASGAGMRWAVVTMPGDASVRTERESARGKRRIREERDAGVADAKPSQTATDALNRIEMPKEAVERISEMLTPGSSLIVSDHPMSEETGRDTDFIILTH